VENIFFFFKKKKKKKKKKGGGRRKRKKKKEGFVTKKKERGGGGGGGGEKGWLRLILASAMDAGEWKYHAPTVSPPGKEPRAHYIGSWMGPRACLDVLEKR